MHRAIATLRPNPAGRGAVARVVFSRYQPPTESSPFDAQVEGELGVRNPPTGFV